VREIIVDNFAGGGGSTGIEMAPGVSPDIANQPRWRRGDARVRSSGD
jgi:hypothetical protein